MPHTPAQAPPSIASFGELLKYLRRRARLTQRQLAIEVGYSEVHISRLEGGYRPPDEQLLLALFVPALDLQQAPELVSRLLELARGGRGRPRGGREEAAQPDAAAAACVLEAIPLPPAAHVVRREVLGRLHQRLTNDRVIAVCGLPGMGKTTLAATLARDEAPLRPVFWLTLTVGVTASVSVLVRQLALFLLAHGQTQVQAMLAQGDKASTKHTLDEQIGLLSTALTRLAWQQRDQRATPYNSLPLLCFDNVHLVQDDPLVMQLLRHLIAATPSALLLLSRDQVRLPGIATVELAGLERPEGEVLIARLCADLVPALAERLFDKTGGNPLLLRLALGMLDQHADRTQVIGHLEQAPQIAYLLDATVRQLSVPAAHLLALVAVFRQPLNLYEPALLDLLEPADGIPDLALARTEMQRRCLLDHPSQAALPPLLREHVYAGLATDRQRKQRLHELAATWSARVTNDEVEAAHHYAAAGNITAAGELLREAQHRISQQGRAFAAVDVIDVLLVLVRRCSSAADDLRQLLTLRADLLVGTRRAAEAEANYRAALQLTLPPTLRAPLAARLAESLVQRGQAEEAILVCIHARVPLHTTQSLLLAQLSTAEGYAQLMLSNNDAALCCARQALEHIAPLQRAAPQAAAEVRARAHQITAMVFHYRQHLEAAASELQQMLTAARQGNLAHLVQRCQSDRVRVYFALGDLESAIAVSRETVPQLQAAHDSYALGRLLSFTSLSYLMHGDLEAALDATEQANEIAEAIGDTHGQADTGLRRSRVLIALGRICEAHYLVERLLAAVVVTGDLQIFGYGLDRLAMIQLLQGDAAAATITFERALAVSSETFDGKLRADVQNHLALALLVGGDDLAATRALASRSTLRLPTSTVLTHRLITALLMLARGDDPHDVAAAAAAIAADADATAHYLFSRAARRLVGATNALLPRAMFPQLHWVETR